MKIALFTDTYNPQINGVVTYLNNAISLLTEANQVVLFAPGEGPFRIEEVSQNLRVYWIPSSPFPFYEGYRVAHISLKRIEDLLRKERPDVAHSHAPINLGIQGLLAAKKIGIPTVITYHTHFPDYVPHILNGNLPSFLEGISKLTAQKMIKHTFKMADIVTAPTQELAGELRSYGLHNVRYLPNGIEPRKLGFSKKEVASFKRDHGIPKGSKVVVYLGRISLEKRLERLLMAFRMIERKDRLLLMAGGGPYLDKIKRLSREMGIKNVVFTGYVRDIGTAYASGDIFVSPSDSETFGLTFVEAMFIGLPVIGVRRFGAKELIIDGKTGILVEPDDIFELAQAMESLLDDKGKRSRMGKEGRKRASGYTIERSIKKTMGIYRSLTKG